LFLCFQLCFMRNKISWFLSKTKLLWNKLQCNQSDLSFGASCSCWWWYYCSYILLISNRTNIRCFITYFNAISRWYASHSQLPCLLLSGTSWPWSYGSWIYNYLCNQRLSPLMTRTTNSVIRSRHMAIHDVYPAQFMATVVYDLFDGL
jgi:hypothetical protein